MGDQDVYLKLLTQGLSGGAMRFLGVENVELIEALPTELPAGELRLDTVWRMVDGRIFHLEFQQEREPTLERFLEYDTRLIRRYHAPVRTVILYGARVASAPDTLEGGSIQYQVENVFLREFRGDDALDVVAKHAAAQSWEPEDRLRLALALGMQVTDRSALLRQMLELISQVPQPEERDLVTAAVLALAERALTDEEIYILERELRTVSKILERSEQRGLEQGMEQGMKQGMKQGSEQALEKVARAMLADGDAVAKIVRVTGLTYEVVEALKTH